MNKPNLFIVGAPKAGTTFLFHKLQNSKLFFFSRVKELNYFTHEDLAEKGSYYKDFRTATLKEYMRFYKNSNEEKYIVDSSVSNFAYPKAAQRIKEFNPNAKILIIIRNPILRAFSHYNMDKRMGYANQEIIKYISEPENYPNHYHQYIKNSLYHQNIINYINLFGEKNLHIMVLERLEEDLPKLFDFLKIDYFEDINTTEKLNENKEAKNKIGQLIQHNRKLASKLKLIMPRSYINHLKKYLYKSAKKAQIEPQEYEAILSAIRKDLVLLKINLGIDCKELWKIDLNEKN